LKLFVRAAEAQKYFLDQGFLPHAGFCNYQIPFEGQTFCNCGLANVQYDLKLHRESKEDEWSLLCRFIESSEAEENWFKHGYLGHSIICNYQSSNATATMDYCNCGITQIFHALREYRKLFV